MKKLNLFFILSSISLLVISSCANKSTIDYDSSSEDLSISSDEYLTSIEESLSSFDDFSNEDEISSEETSGEDISSEESLTSEELSLTSEESSTSEEIIDDYQIIETFKKRMPAEFEPSKMIKMCYPNNMPLSVYKTIAENNKLLILVNPNRQNKSRITEAKTAFTNANINMDNVTFIDMNIDDDEAYWVRDFSPFYVFNNKDLSIIDFTYNRSYRQEQNAVPSKLATYFGMDYQKMNLVHTGGNLMQDGRGTSFSDDLVIRENNNNKSKVLSEMETYTGTDNYVITIDPQGDYIAHIDCWAKIVAPDKIVVARLPQSNSRYQYYEEVADILANTKCAYGYNYRIYRIDEPGGNVVAPYTNSLIANNYVYMPLGQNETYNQKAIETYKEALPGYNIIGVQGYSFSNSLSFLNTDALHCRTHEVPDDDMLFIDSREVYSGEVSLKDEYLIKTNIVSYADKEIDDKDVVIHYSINNEEYIECEMNRYKDTTNFTFSLKNLSSGDDIKYYITAKDKDNNSNIDPTCGELDPHHFTVA